MGEQTRDGIFFGFPIYGRFQWNEPIETFPELESIVSITDSFMIFLRVYGDRLSFPYTIDEKMKQSENLP